MVFFCARRPLEVPLSATTSVRVTRITYPAAFVTHDLVRCRMPRLAKRQLDSVAASGYGTKLLRKQGPSFSFFVVVTRMTTCCP